MLVPAPWREAFGQARPYKIGSLQPLTGAAASAGRSGLIGTEMAVRRINASGGVVADYQSRVDTGQRMTEKLVTDDKIDVPQGGFLSDVCLACLPLWDRHRIVNMIGACLDTRLTTSACSRYSFRPFDYSPAQAVAFAPSLVKMAKRWHIIYSDYTWGASTRDAYANEIKSHGGHIVGTTRIPVGTADMTPFLRKIGGSFDGLFGIFFGTDGVAVATQAYDLGLTKKYRWAGDGAIATGTNLTALGVKIEGFVGIDGYLPVFESTLDTPYHRRWFFDVVELSKKFEPQGITPDRYVQSNYEGMNFLRLGMQKSGFKSR
jgi:branched-chain amino acid transport system substrate-binding protein